MRSCDYSEEEEALGAEACRPCYVCVSASIRQHTSAYVSICLRRRMRSALNEFCARASRTSTTVSSSTER
jgi:hypothetical protein